MFGMLRSSGTPLTVLGSVSLACFALMTGLRYANNEDVEVLRLDLLQLVVMAVTFPWFVFIGRRVTRLRRQIAEGRVPREPRPRTAQSTGADPDRGSHPSDDGYRVAIANGAGDDGASASAHGATSRRSARRQPDFTGQNTLHHERIDLRHVVDAAVEANRPLIEEMGHVFSVSAPSEPAFLNADPVRFAQIFRTCSTTRQSTRPPEGG